MALTYTIYRYEKDGIGPYRHPDGTMRDLAINHAGEDWPGLFDDVPLRFYKKDLLSGFSHMSHLNQWFIGWHNRLKEEGFEVHEIIVSAVTPSISGKQTFFLPEHIISKKPYVEFNNTSRALASGSV